MHDKLKYYDKILQKNRSMNFYTPAEQMLQNSNFQGRDNILYETTACMTAPVLVSYVLWVLENTKQKGIQRLYFLARDGYIMQRIAEILCRAYQWKIECRYFYCSRYALRMPLFLIDKEEALDKVCINGYCVTADIVLDRVGLNDQEKKQIFSELGIESKKQILSKAGLAELRQRLEHCDTFLKLALKRSNESYSMIYSYFLQEGVFDSTPFAVVDTGWTGSMQRSIRQLMEFSGCKTQIQGYYFGMYENGKPEDGIYNCFYFSPNNHYFRSINFNNNLFECLCSADHGMTIGYKKIENGKIIPILNPYSRSWNVELQLQTAVEYTERFVTRNKTVSSFQCTDKKMEHLLLKSFMAYPSREEADMYGNIRFCDDSTEKYMHCLSEKLSKEDIRQQLVVAKIIRKMFKKHKKKLYSESFWIQGTLAKYEYPYNWFIHLNFQFSVFIYTLFRYLKL